MRATAAARKLHQQKESEIVVDVPLVGRKVPKSRTSTGGNTSEVLMLRSKVKTLNKR